MNNKIKFKKIGIIENIINFESELLLDNMNKLVNESIEILDLTNLISIQKFFMESSLNGAENYEIEIDNEYGTEIIINSINKLLLIDQRIKKLNLSMIPILTHNFILFIIKNHELLSITKDEYKELLICILTEYNSLKIIHDEFILNEVYKEFDIKEDEKTLRKLFTEINSIKIYSKDCAISSIINKLVLNNKCKEIDQYDKFFEIISLNKRLDYKIFDRALETYVVYIVRNRDVLKNTKLNVDIVKCILNGYITFINKSSSRISYKTYNKILNGIDNIKKSYYLLDDETIDEYINEIRNILLDISKETNNLKIKQAILNKTI